ncbi:hypothetical protein V6N11_036039 [Hibiscus sabdariffa]|uniref:Uncharacterized protein n=1 Tax=Hibiscus sabdariffa TaxID=183260 RepID=A0ABR2R976_9ROSI
MVKITLFIVLISMIMILSVQSVVGNVAVSSTPITDVETIAVSMSISAGPVMDDTNKKSLDDTNKKSPSWADWTKKKISGIEVSIGKLFSSSSSSRSASTPTPTPTPDS